MPLKDIEARKLYLAEYKRRKRAERNALLGKPKRGPKAKTIEQYERESTIVGDCLIHPTNGAARKLFFMRHPEIPKHLYVCHKCDAPLCIKDAHHFAGTPYDNIMDAVQKGRHSCFKNVVKRREAKLQKGLMKHSEETKKLIGEHSKLMWARRRSAT